MMEKLMQLAKSAGFSHVGSLDTATLELKEEVRQMCAACGQYGKRWSCPPGCGSLEELRIKVSGYKAGILVQTTGQLEDAFDGEAMMETEALHKENFACLHKMLRETYPGLLALGAGCCTICRTCAYPDEPCRIPEQMVSSMEAYGLVVTEVCRANGLAYNYGENTITYTSCFLLD